MGRKPTRKEAFARLEERREEVDAAGHASAGTRAAFALAKGLVYLDPLNRIADAKIVLPLDMVAIPAYQAYMIEGTPSTTIYIRAGETIVPTGGNVQDFNQGVEEAAALETPSEAPRAVKTKSAYTKRYERAFKALKPKHTLKNGKWKKNGFRACVKSAHAMARKG